MRFLITGISGFVARHFLEYLSSLNGKIEIVGIYHSNHPAFDESEFKHLSCTFYPVDLCVDAALDRILASFSPTHILHLAARSSVADSWKNPDKCILQNSSMFLYLLESVRRANIQPRILSVGSAEEYGNIDSENLGIPIRENFPLNPISPYGIARQIQYNLTKIYSHHYGLDIIHTRSFNHFGAYQLSKFVIPSFAVQIVQQYKQGEKTIQITGGDKTVIRDFTDVRDVVKAYYLLLLKAPAGEVYNVCSGRGYQLEALIGMMTNILGVDVNYTIDPRYLRPNENKSLIGNPSKLIEATGWEPQYNIRESLTDLLEYWKQNISQ